MPHEIYFSIWIFVLGAVFGSFENVLIHRSKSEIPFTKPRSFCPSCRKEIAWYDNIPLISFIILKAKCRNCKESISFRYFAVELVTATLFLLSFMRFGFSYDVMLGPTLLFIVIAVPLFIRDFEDKLIPNRIVIPGLILMAVLSGILAITQADIWFALDRLIGFAVAGAPLWALSHLEIRGKQAMGGGDWKLAALIGIAVGWKGALVALFMSFMIGGIASVFLLMIRNTKLGEGKEIPFGPFLIIAGYLSCLYGSSIGSWIWRIYYPSS